MAAKNGCNMDYRVKLENPGSKATMRMVPGEFARNDLAKSGANKDLGGGAKKPGKGKG